MNAIFKYENPGTKSVRGIKDEDELERYYPKGI